MTNPNPPNNAEFPDTNLPDNEGAIQNLKADQPLETTPLNVASQGPDEIGRALPNFTPRRFVLDGRRYASVEGWYQGLKWPDKAKRTQIAKLTGSRAKDAVGTS